MNGKPEPDDLLTAREMSEQYGYSRTFAQSIIKNLSRRGLLYEVPGVRRVLARRRDVEPVHGDQSGGTT